MIADSATIRAAIAAVDGPVVVCAHSYGGIPATEAAAGAPNVVRLVYLCAYQLDIGDSLARACPVDHGTGSRSQMLIEATSMVTLVDPLAFVVTGGHGAELLELGKAAFHGVALLVPAGVEGGRATAGLAAAELSDDAKEAIAYGTAERLLGLAGTPAKRILCTVLGSVQCLGSCRRSVTI